MKLVAREVLRLRGKSSGGISVGAPGRIAMVQLAPVPACARLGVGATCGRGRSRIRGWAMSLAVRPRRRRCVENPCKCLGAMWAVGCAVARWRSSTSRTGRVAPQITEDRSSMSRREGSGWVLAAGVGCADDRVGRDRWVASCGGRGAGWRSMGSAVGWGGRARGARGAPTLV